MTLNCPRCCDSELEEIEVGDVLLDRCNRCAGIWFDHAEISALVGRREGLNKLESVAPAAACEETTMCCPRCPEVVLRCMELERGNRTTVVYRCVSCAGTWLDRGELREIEDPVLEQSLTRYFATVLPKAGQD